jgi:hypothetical protein
VFNQSKGNTWAEFQKEIQGMIQPVADVRNNAAKGAEGDMTRLADTIADFQARMKAEADGLEHPEPPGDLQGKVGKTSEKSLAIPTDSLTRVGNFLGGGANMIQQMNQHKISLLQQIAHNTSLRGSRGAGHVMGHAMGGMNTMQVPTF